MGAESAAPSPQTLTHLIWVVPAKEVVGTVTGGVSPAHRYVFGARRTAIGALLAA